MTRLIERGLEVVIATKNGASPARLPADRAKEIRRRRKQAKYLAIEPRLLFDEKAIESIVIPRWLRRRSYEELFEQFKTWLREGDSRSLREYGELYVYRVGDWYEIDSDLTSILYGHVLLLAKAAFDTGSKLPCKLVEPQRKRQRRENCGRQAPAPVEQPLRLGQLGFRFVSDEWSH